MLNCFVDGCSNFQTVFPPSYAFEGTITSGCFQVFIAHLLKPKYDRIMYLMWLLCSNFELKTYLSDFINSIFIINISV